MRITRTTQPANRCVMPAAVVPRGETALGISVRPLQAEAFGLDPTAALDALLPLPFRVVRLAAYWDRMEPRPGRWLPQELDAMIDAAERAGKQIIVGVGAVKNFGYPEYFVPPHRLDRPLREGELVTPATHARLLDAALDQVTRVVQRYRDVPAIIAWQVEHEPLDPLGLEHSWRLGAGFVEEEIGAVRASDARRPVVLNGYLATSPLVRLHQRWRTRGQGDSFKLAFRSADIVGVDVYPRQALVSVDGWGAYLTGGRARDTPDRLEQVAANARGRSRRIMVTEGQAEPWESRTVPPSPHGRFPTSCTPADIVRTYNRCMTGLQRSGVPPEAYLFWGAEYWSLRARSGDRSYLAAFEQIVERS